MENFRHVHVEEDVSSSDESDPKRHMSDNSDSTPKKISNLKNVVLLLDSVMCEKKTVKSTYRTVQKWLD